MSFLSDRLVRVYSFVPIRFLPVHGIHSGRADGYSGGHSKTGEPVRPWACEFFDFPFPIFKVSSLPKIFELQLWRMTLAGENEDILLQIQEEQRQFPQRFTRRLRQVGKGCNYACVFTSLHCACPNSFLTGVGGVANLGWATICRLWLTSGVWSDTVDHKCTFWHCLLTCTVRRWSNTSMEFVQSSSLSWLSLSLTPFQPPSFALETGRQLRWAARWWIFDRKD